MLTWPLLGKRSQKWHWGGAFVAGCVCVLYGSKKRYGKNRILRQNKTPVTPLLGRKRSLVVGLWFMMMMVVGFVEIEGKWLVPFIIY